jgi:mono/diheme cytochrome c family protein
MKRAGLLPLLGLLVGVAAATVLFWRGPAGAGPVVINGTAAPPVPTLDTAQVERGAALYGQYCASCHGANLEGQPNWKERLPDGSLPAPPHDDSGHTWHHADALLRDIITRGGAAVYGSAESPSTMPALGDVLSEADTTAILAFLKSRWGQEQREYQWWMTATGK